MTRRPTAFELASTFVHLGLGAVATELPGFSWDDAYLEDYERRTAEDGVEGRLVSLAPHRESWANYERHPAGDELVVVLSGQVVVIQDLEDGDNAVELGPLQAVVNPRGIWHTADVLEPGDALYVTPGAGTEHRPRG